jgi:Thioredoxin domain-containing protein
MVMTCFPSLYRTEQLSRFEEQKTLLRTQCNPLFVVAFFCAEWCAVCRDFAPLCEQIASRYRQQYTDTLFVLLDVEDDASWTGELTIDDFPMMVIFRNHDLVHFGVVRAHEDAIMRALETSRGVSRALNGYAELQRLQQILVSSLPSSTVSP